MNWAVMTKKGMAIKEKLSKALYITSGTINRGVDE
jgi:hypothetical protein